jgi:hypothetical protein
VLTPLKMSELEINIRSKADLEGAKQAESAVRNIGTAEKEAGAAAKSWREFVSERMGPYMKQYGDHAGAIRQIAVEWKAYKAELASTPSIPSGTVKSARDSAQAILEAQSAVLAQSQAIAQAGKTQEAYLDQLEASTPEALAFASAQEEIARTLQTAKKATEEQTAAIGEAGLRTGHLGTLVGRLTRDFPMLGIAARLALNPIVGIVTALTLGYQQLKRGIDAVTSAFLDQSGPAAGSIPEAHRRALHDAAIAAESYADQLNRIATAQQTITDRANASIEAIRAQVRAQAEIESAEKALRLAKIDAAESLGRREPGAKGSLTPEQAITARFNLDKEFTARAAAREAAADQAEIDAREKELASLRDIVGLRAAEVANQRERRDEIAMGGEKIPERIAATEADLAKAKEALEAATAAKEKIQQSKDEFTAPKIPHALRIFELLQSTLETIPLLLQTKELDTQAETARTTVETATAANNQLKDLYNKYQQALAAADRELQAREAAERETLTRKTELEGDLPAQRAAAQERQSTRTQVNAIETQAKEIRTRTQIDETEHQRRIEFERQQDKIGRDTQRSLNSPTHVPLSRNDGMRQSADEFTREFNAFFAEERAVIAQLVQVVRENRRLAQSTESRRVDSMG